MTSAQKTYILTGKKISGRFGTVENSTNFFIGIDHGSGYPYTTNQITFVQEAQCAAILLSAAKSAFFTSWSGARLTLDVIIDLILDRGIHDIQAGFTTEFNQIEIDYTDPLNITSKKIRTLVVTVKIPEGCRDEKDAHLSIDSFVTHDNENS